MLLWIIAAVSAFFVKGLCGFANTLVFTTVLSFGTDNINISPVELLLGYPSNLIIAWKERRSIDLRLCLPLIIMVLAGSIPGMLLLKNAGAGVVKIIFGFVIILVAAEMLFREFHGGKTKGSKIVLTVIGLLSGILCGLYGIGALLGAYVGRVTEDSRSFKANICLVFVVENSFRIIMYSVMGIIGPESLRQAAILLPFMLAGLGLGMLCGRFMKDKLVKKLVIVMLMVSGLALVINNF